MDIIQSKLTEPYYRIIQYSTNKGKKVYTQLIPVSEDIFHYLRNQSDSIYSGYIASYLYSKTDILEVLQNALTHYHIRIHNYLYKQTTGIPQGSILSVPLCNLYLRVFEKSFFSSFALSKPLQVIRFVDDYLLLSFSRSSLKSVTVLSFVCCLMNRSFKGRTVIIFSLFPNSVMMTEKV